MCSRFAAPPGPFLLELKNNNNAHALQAGFDVLACYVSLVLMHPPLPCPALPLSAGRV